ncbi:MAG: hypothetical protein GX163_01840 [Bacteroidetes bacterium]|jgi:hypothetical protein|nr:hypothetical protein [Bacteroidota bacterium]
MLTILYTTLALLVQPAKAPPPPRLGNTPNAPQAPIDGELWILLLIGLIVGIFFLYKQNKLATRK